MATGIKITQEIEIKKIEKINLVQLTLSQEEAKFLINVLGGLICYSSIYENGTKFTCGIYKALENSGIKSDCCYYCTLGKYS